MELVIPFALRAVCAALWLLSLLSRSRRWLLVLALVGGLLASIVIGPILAAAAEAAGKPGARLQVIVKSVKIHDDREGIFSGDGEMKFFVGIWHCTNGLPLCESAEPAGVPNALPGSVASMAEALARSSAAFSAGTGDTRYLNTVTPGAPGQWWGKETSEENGFAVYPGQQYTVQFDMFESDGGYALNHDEYMGYVYQRISLQDLALGEHTARSIHQDGGQGDYTITYEILPAPVAEVHPGDIKVTPLAGSTKSHVCISVYNGGKAASGSMYVELDVDGIMPLGGRVDAATLGAHENGLSCVDVVLPTSGQHTLTAIVDSGDNVLEYSELNNVLNQPYVGAKKIGEETPDGSTSDSPMPTPTPSGRVLEEVKKAELTVASIEVNGQQPDGKNDCKDGKNEVAIIVKNDGSETAKKVTVELTVADGQPVSKVINEVAPGKSAKAAFEDIGLKKGQQQLTAAVDSKGSIDEADEGNNGLVVTATCAAR